VVGVVAYLAGGLRFPGIVDPGPGVLHAPAPPTHNTPAVVADAEWWARRRAAELVTTT
jgi:hypothetical protein